MTSKDRIRFWILEHAYKYGMEKVISEIYNLGPEFRNNNDVAPIYPALLYLRRWRLAVNANGGDKLYLRNAVIIIRYIYCRTDVIPLEFFVVIYVRLAMLMVILSLQDSEIEKNLGYVDEFFPSWSVDVEKDAMKTYKITNKYKLEKFKRTMGNCRRCTRSLLTSSTRRRVYLETSLKRDIGLYVKAITTLFSDFFDAMAASQLPATVIDEFLSGQRTSTSAPLDFVKRLRRLGTEAPTEEVEELFLNVLLEMMDADKIHSPDTSSIQGTLELQLTTANSPSDQLSTFTEYWTCPTSLVNDNESENSSSPRLSVNPRSRKRIVSECEQMTASTSSSRAQWSPGSSSDSSTDVTVIFNASPSASPSSIVSVRTSSSPEIRTSSGTQAFGNLEQPPSKKRVVIWPTMTVHPSIAKTFRQARISLRQVEVRKYLGETYEIFS